MTLEDEENKVVTLFIDLNRVQLKPVLHGQTS